MSQTHKQQQHKENANIAPLKACVFSDAMVQFAEAGAKDDFSIVGYSGEIIPDHWFWGNVAFDLQGIKFAKQNTPVLEEHFTSRRLGFATSQNVSDKVQFTGKYLDNPAANSMKNDIKSGFPMEASLYIPPSSVEFVKDGETVQVNGKTLKGPGAVFRKSMVKEVSMCVFGADSNTSVTGFGNNNENVMFSILNSKEQKMAAEINLPQLTVETFKSENPEIYQSIFKSGMAEGEKKERDLFKQLQGACGDDGQLLIECFEQGKTEIEALKMRNERLVAKLAVKPASAPVAVIEKSPDPAKADFSDVKVNKPAEKAATDKTTDELKADFAASKDLQAEFGMFEAYQAFINAEKNGQIEAFKREKDAE